MTYEEENAHPCAEEYGVRAPEPQSLAAGGPAPAPRGMPRRPPPRTAEVERVMRREFDVIIEGSKQRLPLGEAIMMQLAHRALRGEIWAVNNLVKLMGDAEKTRAAQDAARAKREIERARNNARIKEQQAAARETAREAERAAEMRSAGAVDEAPGPFVPVVQRDTTPPTEETIPEVEEGREEEVEADAPPSDAPPTTEGPAQDRAGAPSSPADDVSPADGSADSEAPAGAADG